MARRPELTDSNKGRFWRGAKNPTWNAKRSLITLVGTVVLLFFLSPLIGENGLPAYFQLRSEKQNLEREVEQLRRTSAQLEQHLEDLKNDPATLERLARERYGMHYPDEEVIEIVGEDQ
jgi:cell division protein FtsB